MRVVIIGGGLSGLAAAYELEQQRLPYTLIEVKARLGGAIISEHCDSFVLDGGPFVLDGAGDWSFLSELGLDDSLMTLDAGRVAFKQGTGLLVDALARRLTGSLMKRMAVSSLGRLDDGRFSICLENGLMLDATALIVAAPARYAERMFRALVPEIAGGLMDFRYDRLVRVSLGYRREVIKLPPDLPEAMCAFCHWIEAAPRVPPGHILVQLGLRLDKAHFDPGEIVAHLRGATGWPEPLVQRVDHWPEADPLTSPDDIAPLQSFLPDGVALIGSDYGSPTIPERIAAGRAAARRIAAWVENR